MLLFTLKPHIIHDSCLIVYVPCYVVVVRVVKRKYDSSTWNVWRGLRSIRSMMSRLSCDSSLVIVWPSWPHKLRPLSRPNTMHRYAYSIVLLHVIIVVVYH